MKEFAEQTPPWVKLAAAVEDARTPYIQCFSDDDAACPETMADRVTYLEQHPNFSGCLGRQMYGRQFGAGDFMFWFEHQAIPGTFENDDPLERMRTLATNWVTFTYSTLKTSVARRAFCAARDIDPKGFFLAERVVNILILAAGKMALLNSPTLALSVHGRMISAKTGTNPRETFLAPDFGESYAKYAQRLRSDLEELRIQPPGRWDDFIDRLFVDHLTLWHVPNGPNRHPIKSEAMQSAIQDALDYWHGIGLKRDPDNGNWLVDTQNRNADATRYRKLLESSSQTLSMLTGYPVSE